MLHTLFSMPILSVWRVPERTAPLSTQADQILDIWWNFLMDRCFEAVDRASCSSSAIWADAQAPPHQRNQSANAALPAVKHSGFPVVGNFV